FYFREDNYTQKLNEEQKRIYTNHYDPEKVKKDENFSYEENIAIDDLKLEEFKVKIISSGSTVTHYTGKWDENLEVRELREFSENVYKGGFKEFYGEKTCEEGFEEIHKENKDLKKIILDQLKKELIKEFPDNEEAVEVEGLEKELKQQDLFRELNSHGFIGRKGDFDDLNSYVNSDDNRLFVLTAEAGLGKTTLIANYITHHLKNKDNLIYRFAGASDDSSNEYNLWSSILEEAQIEVPPTIRKFEEKKEEIFNELAEKNSIIILDGINQITNGLAMTDWIDKPLAPNLKIILSFKEDESTKNKIDNIKNNKEYYFSSEILPLDNDKDKKDQCADRKKLINNYLENYLKALDEEDINIICESKGTKNPLLLKILLSELRLFGIYEELSSEIERFGETPEKAFNHILERLEKEDTINGFVTILFGLLANAQVGLSITELKEIISKELKKDENIITDSINLFIRQVKPFIARREGRYDYFYDNFKIAAKKRYEHEKYYNGLLADYFQLKTDPEEDYTFKGANLRDFNELPYHLVNSNKIAILEEILGHYTWTKNKSELNNIFNTYNDFNYIDVEKEENYHLKIIKNILFMDSDILKDNIKSLPTQLWGRLKTSENTKVKELLNEIDIHTNYPWLKPYHHMNTPEGPLQKILEHTSDVISVGFSPDGKHIASATDETVRVWEWETPEKPPKKLKNLSWHEYNECFSPDGKYIASGSWDNTVSVWEWEKPGKPPKKLKGHTNWVEGVCFSPEGKYIASWSKDRTVRVWKWKKPEKPPKILKGHTKWVESLCFSPDGKYIASTSGDKAVRVWEWKKPEKPPKILKGHTNDVLSVCFSPDGKYIASWSKDLTVRVWEWKKPEKPPKILKGHTSHLYSVRFSPDGKYIASGSGDTTVRVWEWKKPEKPPKILKGHTNWVESLCFSPDGKYIASGSGDTSVHVWKWKTPTKPPKKLKGHTNAVQSVRFSPDGKYIASGSRDKTVRVWAWKNPMKTPINQKKHPNYVNSLCFSPDEQYIASGSDDTTVRVWEWKKPEKPPKILKGHTNAVHSVCFSPDGKYIASASGGTVLVWLWETPTKPPKKLKGHRYTVHSVCFSPDGKYIASGSRDNSVRVWEWKNPMKIPKILEKHTNAVHSVCFSPDGKYIASGSADKTVNVWEWKKPEKPLKKLKGHTKFVESVCFSPDGKYIASGLFSFVSVWEWKTPMKTQNILKGHTDYAASVCFSPDGKYIVSGSWDKTIRIWDWKNIKCGLDYLEKLQRTIIRLNTEENIVSCDFSINNPLIIAGGASGQILIYSIENL
ncbi:MAG: WD40 repeat domain-containing protein, partial [Methanobrevibacter sp.]|nr:WD40 repeat domain-containing protein [Methanobrevibacter sp.]